MATTLETLLDQDLSWGLVNVCDDSKDHYKVVPSVVCSMCCLFGVIYCFFGEWEPATAG